jgi:hypothetical protein
MNCPRCQGLIVPDLSCDLAETQGMWVRTLRCMNCGHVTDPTIEKHRSQSSRHQGAGQTLSADPCSDLLARLHSSSLALDVSHTTEAVHPPHHDQTKAHCYSSSIN